MLSSARNFIASKRRKSKINHLREIRRLIKLSKSINQYLSTVSGITLNTEEDRLLEEKIFAHLFAESQTGLIYGNLNITLEGQKFLIVVCSLTAISILFDQTPFQIYEKFVLPAKIWISGQGGLLTYWLYFVFFWVPIIVVLIFLYWAQTNKSNIIAELEYSRRRWLSDDNPVKMKLEKKIHLNNIVDKDRFSRNAFGLFLTLSIWFFLYFILPYLSSDEIIAEIIILYSVLKLFLVGALYFAFLNFQRNRHLNNMLPTFVVFEPYLTSIGICRRKHLDFQSLKALIHNLEVIADWFSSSPLRFRGLGESGEVAIFDKESRKLAKKIHVYKWWVVHPKNDTYNYLSRQLALEFTNLMLNNWDSLLRLSEKDLTQEEISKKELILFSTRKYLKMILNALTPVILLFAFQLTPFRLEGENLEYVAMGVFAFSAIVLLLELNPRYLEYFSGFSDVVKVFRDRKS